MLAFDIECTGLNMYSDRITVASVYDPDHDPPIKHTYNFMHGDVDNNIRDFLQTLDDAEVLCAFNGVRFDLPFIIQRFHVPPERYTPWYLKLFDYFEVAKLVFNSSCSLNRLLESNGEEVKTSSGLQAVKWAEEGEWEKLEDYCMMDTVLTHKISQRGGVYIPLTRKKHVVCTLSGRGGVPGMPSFRAATSAETMAAIGQFSS